jgi:hypothetical protein
MAVMQRMTDDLCHSQPASRCHCAIVSRRTTAGRRAAAGAGQEGTSSTAAAAPAAAGSSPQQRQAAALRLPYLVAEGWLQQVLDTGARPPERSYLVRCLELFPHTARGFSTLIKRHLEAAAAAPATGPGPATPRSAPRQPGAAAALHGPLAAQPALQPPIVPDPSAPCAQYAPWLGRWEPRFDRMHTLTEFVMHARSVGAMGDWGPGRCVAACWLG